MVYIIPIIYIFMYVYFIFFYMNTSLWKDYISFEICHHIFQNILTLYEIIAPCVRVICQYRPFSTEKITLSYHQVHKVSKNKSRDGSTRFLIPVTYGFYTLNSETVPNILLQKQIFAKQTKSNATERVFLFVVLRVLKSFANSP